MSVNNFFEIVEGVVIMHLTRDQKTLLDFDDWINLCEYRWFSTKCSGTFRPTRTYNKTAVLLYRDILPNAKYVDHINRDPLDNRRRNLRECTPAQNSWNTGGWGRSATGVKGIRYQPRNTNNPWVARCCILGVHYEIGAYATLEEAKVAYTEFKNSKYIEVWGVPYNEK